jgi:hypothetical protein
MKSRCVSFKPSGASDGRPSPTSWENPLTRDYFKQGVPKGTFPPHHHPSPCRLLRLPKVCLKALKVLGPTPAAGCLERHLYHVTTPSLDRDSVSARAFLLMFLAYASAARCDWPAMRQICKAIAAAAQKAVFCTANAMALAVRASLTVTVSPSDGFFRVDSKLERAPRDPKRQRRGSNASMHLLRNRIQPQLATSEGVTQRGE